MNKTCVPIIDVKPTKEYHTNENHNLTVDSRLYLTSVPTSAQKHHAMFYDNPRALEPPRLPLQTEDEPEFIKVSIPTSLLPRSPQRHKAAIQQQQDLALQNYLDPNVKRSPFSRQPYGHDGSAVGAGLKAHLSNEEEFYFDQTIAFSDHKSKLVTEELLEQQARYRYQLQNLHQAKGSTRRLTRPHDSPFPNL